MRKKIVIFGGSFDPIHNGHVYLAKSVIDLLQVDRLIFVPCNISSGKNPPVASAKDRLSMINIVIKNNSDYCFDVSDYEISKVGISYSIDTVEYFKKI